MTHPKWLELAWRDVGVQEKKGALSNPNVMKYYRDVGAEWVENDGVAWCAAFVGSCLVRSGMGSTRSLMARSYLKWGRKLSQPKQGAVAVFSRGASKTLGHVGFYVGENGRSIFILGGNQSDGVNISTYPKSRLLGYRWPKEGVGSDGPAARVKVVQPEFERALKHVLEFEGGWTNDPQDPGGPTNKGITLEVYAENKGVKVSRRNHHALMKELREIPDGLVREIYLKRYWLRAGCEGFPSAVAFIHFDAAVNHGPTRAIKMVQQVVGVDVDGEIGPISLAAINNGDLRAIVNGYANLRDRFYRSLHHFPRFGRGWLRRLVAARERALALTGDEIVVGGGEIQTKRDQSNMTHEPKWWTQSMTIWGAIVTALTTVVPVIGPLLGFDISGDMVAQFGEEIARIIQATGGVIGTIMTIYGRLRSETSLQRRKLSFDF